MAERERSGKGERIHCGLQNVDFGVDAILGEIIPLG